MEIIANHFYGKKFQVFFEYRQKIAFSYIILRQGLAGGWLRLFPDCGRVKRTVACCNAKVAN
jgi:hypothetical protein